MSELQESNYDAKQSPLLDNFPQNTNFEDLFRSKWADNNLSTEDVELELLRDSLTNLDMHDLIRQSSSDSERTMGDRAASASRSLCVVAAHLTTAAVCILLDRTCTADAMMCVYRAIEE
eukprot:707073_1